MISMIQEQEKNYFYQENMKWNKDYEGNCQESRYEAHGGNIY